MLHVLPLLSLLSVTSISEVSSFAVPRGRAFAPTAQLCESDVFRPVTKWSATCSPHQYGCRDLASSFLHASADDSSSDAPKVDMQLAPASDTSASRDDDSTGISSSTPSPDDTSTTAFMISQSMRRVLIEELGFQRADVDRLRPELAGPIVEKRLQCPPGGMPSDWYTAEGTVGGGMMERLENESKYPLKAPLLGVNTGFRGASLAEEFMGVPVLAIDLLCVILGAGLGTWTWKTMRD